MEDLNLRLREKEASWIRVWFESGGNATEATRAVYGGTPISCCVKGHKRLRRLTPVIEWILDRGLDLMSYKEEEALWRELAETRG